MSEHIVSRRTYVTVWALLMLLTSLTAYASGFDLGPWSAPVAMVIAGTKASLVVVFFMHLKYSNPVTRVAAAAGVFWLAVMLLLTCADFFTRSWSAFPNQ
jgi:cytochrome c oxidase subunit IV